MGGKSNMIELIKQEPRDDGRDMIIPFSVTLKDGCLTVECEEGLVETAQEYERRFSEQPFSEEARRFVADAVEAETAGTHFSLDRSDLALDTVMLCYNGKPEALDRYILRPQSCCRRVVSADVRISPCLRQTRYPLSPMQARTAV